VGSMAAQVVPMPVPGHSSVRCTILRNEMSHPVSRPTRHITGHFGDDFTTNSVIALNDDG